MPGLFPPTRRLPCPARPAPRRRGRAGFTLIELLVVVAIISLLVGLLVPALGSARRRAREAYCGASLHQLGLASTMYLGEHQGRFWPYYMDEPGVGRAWWFGFEPGGDDPRVRPNRPLVRSRWVLAAYSSSLSDRLQCPDFPYDDPRYYPKFDTHAASYGFNLTLQKVAEGQLSQGGEGVFVFADGIHFDGQGGSDRFNEGHYLTNTANTHMMSGYAHFRHAGKAQVLYTGGHVLGQTLQGPAYPREYAGPAGNLQSDAGTASIYGP